jgi:hypothetical protein
MNIEYNTWPTDNGENHFITVTRSGKSKMFNGSTKKEVKQKLFKWIEKNNLSIEFWKVNNFFKTL